MADVKISNCYKFEGRVLGFHNEGVFTIQDLFSQETLYGKTSSPLSLISWRLKKELNIHDTA